MKRYLREDYLWAMGIIPWRLQSARKKAILLTKQKNPETLAVLTRLTAFLRDLGHWDIIENPPADTRADIICSIDELVLNPAQKKILFRQIMELTPALWQK